MSVFGARAVSAFARNAKHVIPGKRFSRGRVAYQLMFKLSGPGVAVMLVTDTL